LPDNLAEMNAATTACNSAPPGAPGPQPTPKSAAAHLSAHLPAHLVLIGPTASGKTAAAMAIAEHYPVEIISLDSALVYRGMDIGTAKPSLAERCAVPHHLIDIRDPLQSYSAADFVRDASELLQQIHARRRWPLIVGGTMMYLRALHDGLDDMPAANPAVRRLIEQEAAGQGWPAMHALLRQHDPVTAARLAPHDAQRIARALEVWRLSGVPLAHFHASKTRATSAAMTSATASFDTQDRAQAAMLISLEPTQRGWLHQRIAERFDAMLAAGLIDEVRALRARADLNPDLPAMRCVGYRQVWDYLDACDANADGHTLATLRERGLAATRQLAKRQITWLRSMPQRHVVACDTGDAVPQVLALATRFARQMPCA